LRERLVEPIEIFVDRIGSRRHDAARSRRSLVRFGARGNITGPTGVVRKPATEQVVHFRNYHLRLERFHEQSIAANRPGTGLIHRLERPGQEQDRDMREAGSRLHEGSDLVPVPRRHAHVREDDVRGIGLDAIDRMLTVTDGNDPHVLVRKRQLDHALNGDAVVGEQECRETQADSTRARA
jgi:hypothetical protein